jgi:hypothetical protein
MLNPSTADHLVDDPTVRRCIGFANREGAGAMVIVNLFAYRAKCPSQLVLALDPVGPENARILRETVQEAAATNMPVICGWGAHPLAETQARSLRVALQLLNIRMMCLGKTSYGAPCHPLYLKGDTPLVPYP